MKIRPQTLRGRYTARTSDDLRLPRRLSDHQLILTDPVPELCLLWHNLTIDEKYSLRESKWRRETVGGGEKKSRPRRVDCGRQYKSWFHQWQLELTQYDKRRQFWEYNPLTAEAWVYLATAPLPPPTRQSNSQCNNRETLLCNEKASTWFAGNSLRRSLWYEK